MGGLGLRGSEILGKYSYCGRGKPCNTLDTLQGSSMHRIYIPIIHSRILPCWALTAHHATKARALNAGVSRSFVLRFVAAGAGIGHRTLIFFKTGVLSIHATTKYKTFTHV